MFAIEMNDISKSFSGVPANSHVNLRVKKGEIHCLLGENGAGKTTLMKILFGLYRADSGTIRINEKEVHVQNSAMAFNLGMGMVHQHFMLINNLTVLENIILGHECGSLRLDMKTAYEQVKALSDHYHFDLDLNQKVGELSVGMMQRVEILKTVYRGADILILDEPTAVLTPQEVTSLLEILNDIRAEGKTIVFITHKLNETMDIADAVTVLRGGTTAAASIPIQETSAEQLANLMVGRPVSFSLPKQPLNAGSEVLSVQEARLLPHVTAKVNFSIRKGEIFGVAGVDGNGQLQLEEGIMGLLPLPDGDILLNGQSIRELPVRKRRELGIAHIPSDRLKRGVVAPFSLLDNYLLGNQYRERYCKKDLIDHKAVQESGEKKIKDFQVKAASLAQPLSTLSGGNQQKVVLGREVGEDPCLIIAAQPTRGLDIGAIENVHKTLLELRDQGKAILLISGELSEIINLSDRVGVLYKGEFMDIRPTEDYTTEEIGLLMAGRKGGAQHGESA